VQNSEFIPHRFKAKILIHKTKYAASLHAGV